MPIYEYRCKGCGRTFEVLQKFSDEPLKECEGCAGKLEKLISMSSFALKGQGWHKTDYASADKKEDKPAKDIPSKPDCSGCSSC
ncbi:MAG: zinc ribbon domain-containing protein [Deltaproteobacteria bacterium]|nr:zinc ribbon domain-containing protein [Deltaproteobacteria bacterium]